MFNGRMYRERVMPLGDVGSTVGDVTGLLVGLESRLHDAETELEHVKNAITGGAAGAQAGYSAPTSLTPYLIGGGVLVALLLFSKR